MAKDKSANEHIRKEAKRISGKLLRRHKWKASDFSSTGADNPMLTTCEIKIEGALTVFQRCAGRLLVDLIPGLESKDMQHKSCVVVKFSIPHPKSAKEVMAEWGVLCIFMQFEFKTFEDHKCGLEVESFCRGVCRAVWESLVEARRMTARAVERVKARERAKEPVNPFALICVSRPPRQNIEPGAIAASSSASSPEARSEHTPQQEVGGPDTPTQDSAGENLPKVDMRSYAQGFDCGRKWNVERILKLL